MVGDEESPLFQTGFIRNHNPAIVRNRTACAVRVTLITAIHRILANSDSIVSMWGRRHVRTAYGPKQRKGYLPVTARLGICPASRSTARLMTNGQTYANLRKNPG